MGDYDHCSGKRKSKKDKKAKSRYTKYKKGGHFRGTKIKG